MTKRASRSMGTIIQFGLVAVGDLRSIGSPNITQDELDVTTLDSDGAYREFLPGFKDGGEVTVSGLFVPGDAGQAAMYAALDSGDVENITIIYPAKLGASFTFPGYVSAYNVQAELEDAIQVEMTIRVAGKPTLAMTASTGLSALVVTGASGALAPAFDAAKQAYTFAGVTASSVTVTATAADHTLKMYVDGAYVQDLTTAVASAAVQLAAGTAKRLTIVAQETGKASVAYEIIASRGA